VNTSTALRPADWRDRAACRDIDPDLFFPVAPPNTGAGESQVAAARAVCRTCAVTVDCLRFALAHAERDGIWGGTTEGERDAALRNLTRGAA
jgi:WhiB family redox-sensing transcriptional regulator